MIFIPATLTKDTMLDWMQCIDNCSDVGYCTAIYSDDPEAYQDWLVQNREYDV